MSTPNVAVIPAPPGPPIPVPLPNVPSGPVPADAVESLFGHLADGPGDAGENTTELEDAVQKRSTVATAMANLMKREHDGAMRAVKRSKL